MISLILKRPLGQGPGRRIKFFIEVTIRENKKVHCGNYGVIYKDKFHKLFTITILNYSLMILYDLRII